MKTKASGPVSGLHEAQPIKQNGGMFARPEGLAHPSISVLAKSTVRCIHLPSTASAQVDLSSNTQRLLP